jgi:hypothetical protein
MTKRIQLSLLLLSIFAAGIFSCEQSSAEKRVTGTVIDATMNNITLASDAGDTLNISTTDTDTEAVPGVMLSDYVNITYTVVKMGKAEVSQAKALSVIRHSPFFYIAGTWVEPNPINQVEVQGFTLNQDGTASSVNMASLLFKSWEFDSQTLMLTSESIGNRQTLIGTDTLKVAKLDADSLVLARSGGYLWRLARQK